MRVVRLRRAARLLVFAMAITPGLLVERSARADDPAAALEQLKQGYTLKEAGRCADAVPHFVESQRLAPTPKALLNLADCEDQLGDLVSAQEHSVAARDLAQQRADPLLPMAEKNLTALEKRLPRLTIVLAHDAPAQTTASRDGTALGSVSINAALPTNPGKHVVVARAPGRADKRFEIVLAEGARETIEVGPGEALASSPPSAGGAVPLPPPASAPTSSWTPRKTLSLSLVVLGAAGVAAGSVFGILAINKNSDSKANDNCDSNGCGPTGLQLRNEALNDATASTVAFAIGAGAAAAGVILWLTAPATAPTTGVLRVAPTLGPGQGGVSLAGAW
jgi:hypothetical protein